MSLPPPPPRILDDAGRPQFGMYAGAFPEVDLDRQQLPGKPGRLSRMRLKQWEHWLILHPQVAITLAVVDAAVTRLIWVQVIDRRTGERFEHRREGPFVQARVARSLWNEHTRAEASGLVVAMHDHLELGEHRVMVRARSAGLDYVELDAYAACGPGTEPLAVVLPLGRERALYSHKVPLPLRGTLRIGDRRLELDPATCTAVLDVHKAHYPRDTWWNWATCVGFDAAGRRIGVNLTRNVVTDDAYRENAVWIDGKVHLLGPAQFSMGADPWSVTTTDGCALTFTAAGERGEDVNYGVVRSRFRQRYGTFDGRVVVDGEAIPLHSAYGLFEDHQARW